MTKAHTEIEIDPAKLADRVQRDADTGESIFTEADVLKFLIDELNDGDEDIAMIHQDHELAIEYRGRRDYFGIGIAALDEPMSAAVVAMVKLSYLLNDYTGIESWTSYKDGKYALHILRKPVLSAERSVQDIIQGWKVSPEVEI